MIKDIKKDLEDSEEEFRSLVQSIEGYVFMLDRQGRLISVNRALARYLGYSEKHLVGCIYTQIFPVPLVQSLAPYVDYVINTKSWTQFEWHDAVNDRWYLMSLHPVFDFTTKEICAVSVLLPSLYPRMS